jgi:hypothetical protein
MTLGPFIHCIHEFLKYENALDLDFFEKLANNNSCLWKSDFNFEKLASNNSCLWKSDFKFEKLASNNFWLWKSGCKFEKLANNNFWLWKCDCKFEKLASKIQILSNGYILARAINTWP